MGRCWGRYRIFSPQRHKEHKDFYGRSARIRGQWELRFVGGGTGFFHHRGTEGTEIFYGGRARIRGQWELRFVGGGRFFFTTEAQRAPRFFMVEGADSRSVGMALCRGGRVFFTTEAQRAPRFLVRGRGFEVSGYVALLGEVQDFFTTKTQRAQRFLWWEGVDSSVANLVEIAHCWGWYRFFFTTEDTEGTEIFVEKASIRGQWDWRDVRVGTGFFTTEAQRSQRFFVVGRRRFEVSGNGALLGVVGGFFTTEDTEGTEIFMVGRRRFERGEPGGDCALSRVVQLFFTTEAQRAPRFFMVGGRGFEVSGNCALLGVGGFFSPPRHRGHRDFGKSAPIRGQWVWGAVGVVGFFHHRGTEGTEIFGKSAPIRGQWVWGAVGGGTVFFHHKDTKSTKIFMVGRRRFERGESGGNGALSRVVNLVAIAHCRGRYRFFHHKDTVTRQNTRIP